MHSTEFSISPAQLRRAKNNVHIIIDTQSMLAANYNEI